MGIKSVLQCLLYLKGFIEMVYSYTCLKKLAPTLISVSKFDVKLGSRDLILKLTLKTFFWKITSEVSDFKL